MMTPDTWLTIHRHETGDGHGCDIEIAHIQYLVSVRTAMPPLPTRETRRQYAGYYGSRSETRAKAEFQHLHDAEDETRAKQGSSAVGK